MILEFKLRNYSGIRSTYCGLFRETTPITFTTGTSKYVVDPVRIIFPRCHVSVRGAEWSENGRPMQGVTLLYAENETDFTKISDRVRMFYPDYLVSLCEKEGLSRKEAWAQDCKIDTSEFIDESVVQRLYPENYKKLIRKKYSELYALLKGKIFKTDFESYENVNIEVYENNFCGNVLHITLGKLGQKLSFAGYCWQNDFPEDEKTGYHYILQLLAEILSNQKCVVDIAFYTPKDEFLHPAVFGDYFLLDTAQHSTLSRDEIADYLKSAGKYAPPMTAHINYKYWDRVRSFHSEVKY